MGSTLTLCKKIKISKKVTLTSKGQLLDRVFCADTGYVLDVEYALNLGGEVLTKYILLHKKGICICICMYNCIL